MKSTVVTDGTNFFLLFPAGYTTSDALTTALTTANANKVGLAQYPGNDCFFIPDTTATDAQTTCDTINTNLP